MSGGGGKPRGGKMGSSIRDTSISRDDVATAEQELAKLIESLNNLRCKISDAIKCYQAAESAISRLEMELAKGQKEVTALFEKFIVFVFRYR